MRIVVYGCRVLVFLALGWTLPATAQIQSAPPEVPAAEKPARKLPDRLEPTPAPPETKPDPNRPKRTPDETVEAFFSLLKADRVDAAYDDLDADFQRAQAGNDAQRMRDQTQKALDAYGPVAGYELVKEEKFGEALVRRTYLMRGDSLPLRWRFYFYKADASWALVDLRVDDAIASWFDEK